MAKPKLIFSGNIVKTYIQNAKPKPITIINCHIITCHITFCKTKTTTTNYWMDLNSTRKLFKRRGGQHTHNVKNTI